MIGVVSARRVTTEERTTWRDVPACVPLADTEVGIQPGRSVLDSGHDVYRLEGTSRPGTIKC